MLFCPECNGIVEYDAYFKRCFCSQCSWTTDEVNQNRKSIAVTRYYRKTATKTNEGLTLTDEKLVYAK